MYRDDPLDDEFELRALVGDDAVEALQQAALDPAAAIETTLDIMRLLQGWAEDAEVATWLQRRLRRLGDRTPLEALAQGHHEEVHDAASGWIAARA